MCDHCQIPANAHAGADGNRSGCRPVSTIILTGVTPARRHADAFSTVWFRRFGVEAAARIKLGRPVRTGIVLDAPAGRFSL
jgi:hypothetical protein